MDHYDGHIDAMKARERLWDQGFDHASAENMQHDANRARLAAYHEKQRARQIKIPGYASAVSQAAWF